MAKQPKVISDIYPLVIIIWKDHTVSAETWDESIDDGAGLDTLSSVGWLIKETNDSYVISSCIDDELTTFGSKRTIGKGMVEKVKAIKGRMKK